MNCVIIPKREHIAVTIRLGDERFSFSLGITETAEKMAAGLERLAAAAETGDETLAGMAFASLTAELFGAELAEKIYGYYGSRGDELAVYFIPLVLKKLYRRLEKGLRRLEKRRLRAYR